MKKKTSYQSPKIDWIDFLEDDIIRTSQGQGNDIGEDSGENDGEWA
jgi:hypothetical protein